VSDLTSTSQTGLHKGSPDEPKVVFCFHTHDHEVNFGVSFLSAALKKTGIAADLVIYRQIAGGKWDGPEEVVSRILEKGPTIVGLSTMTFNWHKIKPVISLLRKEYDGLIVVGGYHAILSPEEVLSHPGVDAVCIGEGEQPLTELANYCTVQDRKKHCEIHGLIFKGESRLSEKLGKRWIIENLEDYPYFDYDLFNSEGDTRLPRKYLGTLSPSGIFSLPLITGRGCPYRCTYCSNSALIDFYGGPKRFLRRYSPGAAVANITSVLRAYKPHFLEFLDETFTLNKQWVKGFCEHYRKRVPLPFLIMSRIDTIDEPTIALLAESGLKVFLFGIECGDEEYRINYLKRRMSNKAIVEGARLLRKYGIISVTFNMFGMPFETRDTIKKTIALNEEILPDAAIPFIYQPFAGTELGQLAFENGMVPPPPQERWDFCSPSLDTPELPASYVVEVADKFRDRFASRNIEIIYERLRSMVSA
jgi:radical SAM superfamily enzyme YgiQ (UPF0313 family)